MPSDCSTHVGFTRMGAVLLSAGRSR